MPPYQRPTWTPPPYLRPQVRPDLPPLYSANDPIFAGEPMRPAFVPIKPLLDQVPIRRHSRIELLDFLQHRIAPPTPPSFPDIEGMNWRFDKFEHKDDNEVRLYLYLSPEYVAKTEYFGVEHEVFEEEPVADELALQNIQDAMQVELLAAADAHTRAAMELEHAEMLQWLGAENIGLTIADYRAFPFRRAYVNRLKAIQGMQKLNGIMTKLKEKLERIS